MYPRPILLACLLLALSSMVVDATADDAAEQVLENRLNLLESQAIQRRGEERQVLDLLTRQDDKIAGQTLDALKTRDPRNAAVPLLERKLDRSRRPGGRITPR